ncbi:MAG: ATP-binding protein [Proteobacteria bacterium]|nr:ATP-binding protein [Pseudomonadota bacterium]MBU1648210.1 ATP-binding protein [Pseudomonadota bacterium]
MKHEMAMTKNVRRFVGAVRELSQRGPGLEGMGLLGGEPGEGKTTTLAYVSNLVNGVYVRANACWTVTAMLAEISHELGLPRQRFKHPMINGIIGAMLMDPRPIFVDEADYLLRSTDMLDTLRDIYDMVPGACVILVGMEELAAKVRANGRFARRVTQWVEFSGLDVADAVTLASTVCEIPVGRDLVEHLHKETRGNVGRMVVGLTRIESLGRSQGLEAVDLAAWGDRQLFFDQQAGRRKNGGR